MFPRFIVRHGFSMFSPEKTAHCESVAAAFAARAFEPEPVLAQIYEFPSDDVAEVFDLRLERQRRRNG